MWGELTASLARWRVPLGFVMAIVTLQLARPSWDSLRMGFAIAIAGEAIRVWAAGHLEKGREVTQSGPYRWTRHPLYVGSSVLALGIVIASRSVLLGVLAAIYLGSTLTAAIKTEEAFLRLTFGEEYDRYARSEAPPAPRRFSLERARRNREYEAVIGLLAGFGLLALKLLRPI